MNDQALVKQNESLKATIETLNKEISQLRKQLIKNPPIEGEDEIDAEIRREQEIITKAYVERLKALPIKSEGELQDGTYRRFVKIELPRSKQIATVVEADGVIGVMPEDTESETLEKALKCVIILTEKDGKEIQVTDEIRVELHKRVEHDLAAMIQAMNWLRKEERFPQFFRKEDTEPTN